MIRVHSPQTLYSWIHRSTEDSNCSGGVWDYKDAQPVQDYKEAAHSGSLFTLCSVLLVYVQEMQPVGNPTWPCNLGSVLRHST